MSITIIDYGMGNVGSILNMLRKIGGKGTLSARPEEIAAATKLILPGVGAFDSGMRNLEERGLISVIRRKVLEEGTPILGICLGVQLFTQGSEEGQLPGLGLINARTIRFRFPPEQAGLKIPHMGWNTVAVGQSGSILEPVDGALRFYFVHSYHVVCTDPADVLGTTEYGIAFTSAVRRGNITGVQFHPEKSHKFGLQLLRKFVELT